MTGLLVPSTPSGLDGSPCRVDVELGKALRATASLSMFCGGLILLTAEVSIVIVGLHGKGSARLARDIDILAGVN